MGMMGMGAAPLPPEGEMEMGLDPQSAALMAADPAAPEVGPVAPAPVDQALAGAMPPPMPAPMGALGLVQDPQAMASEIARIIEEMRGAAHAELDATVDESAAVAQDIVSSMLAPDPARAQMGGIGPVSPGMGMV